MAQRPGFPWVPTKGLAEQGDRNESPQFQQLRTVFSAFQNSGRSSALALDLMLHELAVEAQSTPGVDSCAIALWDQQKKNFVCRAAVGESAPGLGTQIQSQDGLSAECVRTGRQQICQDTESDPRVDAAVCLALGVRSLVIVPLFLQQRLIGILEVFASIAHAFDKAAIERFGTTGRRIVDTVAFAEGKLRPQAQSVEPLVAEPTIAEPLPETAKPALTIAPAEPTPEVPLPTPPIARLEPQPEILETVPAETRASLPPPNPIPTPIPRPTRQNLGLALVALTAGIVALAGLLWWLPQENSGREVVKAEALQQKEAIQPDSQPAKTLEPNLSVMPTKNPTAVSKHKNSVPPASTTVRNGVLSSSDLASGDLVVYERGKVVYRAGSLKGGENSPVTSAAETEKLRDNINPSPAPDDTAPVATANFTGGRLISHITPMLPAGLSELRSQEVVVVEGIIGKDGVVREIHVLRGDPRLADAATEAVRQWRYEPFRSNGEPVDMLSTMTVHFR
jgi:TonB family protein